MSSVSAGPPRLVAPILFAIWAAAIALAPTLPLKALLAAPAASHPAALVDPAASRALARALLRRRPAAASAPHPPRRFRPASRPAASPPSDSSPAFSGWRTGSFAPTGLNAALVDAIRHPARQRGAGRRLLGPHRRGRQRSRASLLFGISVYIFFYAAPRSGARQPKSLRRRPPPLLDAPPPRRSSPASISTISSPPPPATVRNSSGSIPASIAAPRDSSTKPARSATSAPSSW